MFEKVGSGKTLQVALIMKELGVTHIIAISPKSLVVSKVWSNEVKKWGLNIKVTAVGYSKLQNPDKVNELIASLDPSESIGLVFDEAQAVKSPSIRGKVVKTSKYASVLKNHILSLGGYSLALTGTPITKNQIDLYGVLTATQSNAMLNEIGFTTYSNFKSDYCYSKLVSFGNRSVWIIDDSYQPPSFKVLRDRLSNEFGVIGNVDTSEELSKALRESIEHDIYVEVPMDNDAEINAKIEYIRERLDLYIDSDIPPSVLKEIKLSYNTLKRLFGSRKVAVSIEPIRKIFNEFGQVIVYCYHKDVAKVLGDSLEKCVVITGETSEANRISNLNKFKTGEANYLVATITSMNTGLTLTHCNTMVFVELSYSYTETVQAKARINRLSQKETCKYFFITDKDNKFERRLQQILTQKCNLLNMVMGDHQGIPSSSSSSI